MTIKELLDLAEKLAIRSHAELDVEFFGPLSLQRYFIN